MAQLRDAYQELLNRDTVVLVVGPEDSSSFNRYFNNNGLPFEGLPDPSHKILKLYGQEVSLFKLGRMPAQVIIDKSGKVRYVHYGKKMSDIPKPTEFVEILSDLYEKNE
jgi:peroxiredoxin